MSEQPFPAGHLDGELLVGKCSPESSPPALSPLVSIDLCCYNGEAFLEQAIESICAQTYKNWELVVVNDGSTDSSEDIVSRYQSTRLPIIYHRQANTGLGRARNKAIELSRGEFVAFIDQDDVWMPDKLEKQVALFAGRAELGLVFSDAVAVFPSGREQRHGRQVHLYRGRVLRELVLSNFIPCSSVIIRRTVLEEVGGVNPSFGQVEEYDLFIRVAERYDLDYVNESLMKFNVHPGNASRDATRMQEETIQLMHQVVERNPSLAEQLGKGVVRLKLAGLRCTQGEAYLLSGRVGLALKWYGSLAQCLTDIPRIGALYVLSWLNHGMVVGLIGLWRTVRRHVLLRHP